MSRQQRIDDTAAHVRILRDALRLAQARHILALHAPDGDPEVCPQCTRLELADPMPAPCGAAMMAGLDLDLRTEDGIRRWWAGGALAPVRS